MEYKLYFNTLEEFQSSNLKTCFFNLENHVFVIKMQHERSTHLVYIYGESLQPRAFY
jgi:hypothetical protein